ncbi:MAG: phosphatidylserine decarboxylase [Vicinamibacterales bacterium]
MRIDPAATPFVLIALLPVAAVASFVPWPATAALALLPLAIALFFRDPTRSPPVDPDAVLSPADGRVMHAGPSRPDEAPDGQWQQVTIFLSVLDVHINRTPVAGRITKVLYLPGSFRAAFKADAHKNERSEIWIDHAGVPVVARQVVGLLARRVVCRVAAGQVLHAGDRIGLMKFGSRMDVFVPPSAAVLVSRGAQVRAGETVIARLSPGVRA